MKKIKRLVLELSPKVFKQMDDKYVSSKINELLDLWQPLIKRADSLAFLLWIADGSELLVFNNDMEQKIEWSVYVGAAHGEVFGANEDDPRNGKLYMENPPVLTYSKLKEIVRLLKNISNTRFHIPIEIGTIFDPGPEFSRSDFKYKVHPELNMIEIDGKNISLKPDYPVISPWAKLKEDHNSYAGFPSGIEDNTPFGTFLGRQSDLFMKALGFDYIWLSNGFSYSCFPWTYQGANFNGKEFGLLEYARIKDKLLEFWALFSKELTVGRVEVRGSNFSIGMEIAKDCIPSKEYYDKRYVKIPPPNSPWAALDRNFALEYMGHLSRIAYIPTEDIAYRFYLDDPWFWQTPWIHAYEENSHDIDIPMALSHIKSDGSILSPNIIEILTVNNEYGEFLEVPTLQTVPILIKAIENIPDEIPPVVLLYPFSEYHLLMEENSKNGKIPFFNDWFITEAIGHGACIAGVISTNNFCEIDLVKLKDRIIVAPNNIDGKFIEKLKDFEKLGGKIVFFGDEEKEMIPSKNVMNIKGVLNFVTDEMTKLPLYDPKKENNANKLAQMLAQLGVTALSEDKIIHTLTKKDNGYRFTGFKEDTTAKSLLCINGGMPIFARHTGVITENGIEYILPKAFNEVAKVLLYDQKEGKINCRLGANMSPTAKKLKTYSFEIEGLKNARLLILPPYGFISKLEVYQDEKPIEIKTDERYGYVENVSGAIEISW